MTTTTRTSVARTSVTRTSVTRTSVALAGASSALLALASTSAFAQTVPDSTRPPRVATLVEQALPPMQGDRLKVTVLEVTYAPGGVSRAHVHPCPVFGHVVSGALRMQFKGFPERVYRAGESFYEAANGGHLVGANASATEPAKLVATFVCDREGPLSTPLPDR